MTRYADDLLDSPAVNTDAERDTAQRVVAGHAVDAEDARVLLAMLGLAS